MTISRDHAETIGLQAIAWLAADEELLPVFMGSTGADEATMREGIGDPAFQAAVLDFLLMDDAWLTRFCDETGIDYAAPMQARAILPGGDLPEWT
ncbi:DUF3572 domain-containing protein [Roseivivax sediminis]|uniref:DUF3572 domain-containing protein n=1 Tax=Roseivivax sediminis TaxID=936889 RepID=A0A1I1TBB7_9RHOB|nr:DUF3572 domain-containing protein [Roseivivax sediminis]SFD55911.1 Protein of unknown function [Roseivivax sediminis]